MNNKTILQRARRAMNSDRSLLHFSVPKTRSGYVICVACKYKFYIPERLSLNGHLVPLLLPCGHPICIGCMKNKPPINCPLCNEDVNDNDGKMLPLNLYALGLISASSQRPIESNDQDFGFNQSLAVRLRQIKNQGHCFECEGPATVKCLQCGVLYCSCCYSKIHGRALQNHKQVPIVRDKDDKFISITNNCSPTCHEALSYFCNDCNMAGCSNCMLRLHKLHDYVTLQEKNDDLASDFNRINYQVFENLQRINQTKQKVKSVLYSLDETDYNESVVEASIARHFAYLHGVLQNTEAKLMDQLHLWHGYAKNNLMEIDAQLQTQEERLGVALMMGSYANENFDRVDIGNAMEILKEVLDLPCYLLRGDKNDNEKVTFCADDLIATMMENHCTLKMPPMSRYTLVRKDELPKDYVVEPLKKDSAITNILKASSPVPQAVKQSTTPTSPTAASPRKPEGVYMLEVELTYVVNPSLFFVRPVVAEADFDKLENDLKTYGDNCGTNPLIAIEKDDMCIVKQLQNQKWYRGRVKETKKVGNEIMYDIFYIDYGYGERDIPTSQMQSVIGHFLELPPQIIQCCLYGIAPKEDTWTSESISQFMKLITEAGSPITMRVIKTNQGKLYVDICLPSSNGLSSLCKTMLLMNLAHVELSQNMAPTSKTTYVYNREQLPLNKSTTISVEHIESPDKIYVVKRRQRNTELKKVLAELNEYYKNGTLETEMIHTPMKGLPCAAPRLDNFWSRGEIVEILDDDRIKVFYVDIGCSSILQRNELRVIPYNYTIYNAQAIRISLMYIMPEFNGNWRPEALEILRSIFVSKRTITVSARRKINNGYIGCITVNGNQDVSRLLKQKGVVNTPVCYYDKSSKKTAQNNTIVLSKKSDDSIANLSYSFEEAAQDSKSAELDEATKDPFKMEVCIQQMITPNCIYVAQMDFEESNVKLMSAMQKFYDTYYSEPRDNWSEDALCTAYSAKDKSYFRAKILKIKSPTEVVVYLCDMGLEETVTLKDIQNLHPKFTKEPMYCFKVKLAGILPCGGTSVWPSLSCMTLSDIIQDNGRCRFYITKLVEEACDDAIPVELWIQQTKIPGPLAPSKTEINSINRMLVDKGVALPIKNYFSKADSVLATVFKEQLGNSHQLVSTSEEVQWFNKITCLTTICEMDDDMISHERHLMDNNSLDVTQSKNKHDRSKKLLDWLPPYEIVDEVFHAISTYVDNNCTVYLHSIKHNADILQYIESELQIYFGSAKIKLERNWKEDDLCIAQYHHNKKWYRGKVKKNLGNLLLVEFVDYGNTEECEIEYVTKNIRLEHIPIQCTRCVISGLSPATVHGKWMLHDLDRIHALLVDRKCKVCVLQRQPTQLVISITLFQPRKCELLSYLIKEVIDMDIKIEPRQWNDLENAQADDMKLNSTKSIATDEESSSEEPCMEDISEKSLSESQSLAVTFIEHVISGCSVDHSKSEDDNKEEIDDFENTSWIDVINLDDCIISSTPQNESQEENFISEYRILTIPQETKYIELILCCNRNPTTSYAQLAENNDTMFSDVLRDYYMKYETIMSDLQINACSQPLIESFEKNTPCVAKFSDDVWYRSVIVHSKQVADTSYRDVMLHYIDYGNNEYKQINIESHDLRTPKRDWLELPAMAIECQFSGIEFVSDDINSLAWELDKIYNRVVVAQIKEIHKTLLVAEIYKDKQCQELLYAHLINKGLYRFKKPKED